MPVGFGKRCIRSNGRQLSFMAHLKRRIVEVKAKDNYWAHSLIIATAKVYNNSNYTSYRDGRMIIPVVRNLLVKTIIDLSEGGKSLNYSNCKIIFGTIR